MNICVVNDSFKMGGVARVTIELINSLQERGHEISLIDFSGYNEFNYEVNKGIQKPQVIKQRTIKRKLISKLVLMKNRITQQDNRVSIIYKEQIGDLINFLKMNRFDVLIMNQGVLTALIPLVKRELPKLKIVAWQHNDYDVYIEKYNKLIIKDYLQGASQADLLVCLTKEEQKKYKALNKNATYIYNPLTLRNDSNKISKLKNKQIVFVGRLKIEQKGLDLLIEIAKNINKDWVINVAGDGEDKNKFIQMIKKNKLDDKIILKGSLGTEELVDLYLSGSIFISTSRWEGFGLVLTEAMAFGLPVISFDNSGPREILKNGEYGILVEKNNINDFIVQLNELIEDPVKRKYFQEKSIERVNDFKKDIITEEWELKLKELLK